MAESELIAGAEKVPIVKRRFKPGRNREHWHTRGKEQQGSKRTTDDANEGGADSSGG